MRFGAFPASPHPGPWARQLNELKLCTLPGNPLKGLLGGREESQSWGAQHPLTHPVLQCCWLPGRGARPSSPLSLLLPEPTVAEHVAWPCLLVMEKGVLRSRGTLGPLSPACQPGLKCQWGSCACPGSCTAWKEPGTSYLKSTFLY